MGYLVYSQAQSPLCHRPGEDDGEDDGTRTRNGLAHNQAPQPFGSSSVRNQGLEPRTSCMWRSRSAAELIAHDVPPAGLEPAPRRLKGACSHLELQGLGPNWVGRPGFEPGYLLLIRQAPSPGLATAP